MTEHTSAPSGRRSPVVLTLAYCVTLVLFVIGGLMNLVLGGVLMPRSTVLGLGFAVASAVLFVGLWKSSRIAVGVGALGLVAGPMAAARVGAAVGDYPFLGATLGIVLLYGIWFLTVRHRPWNRASAD